MFEIFRVRDEADRVPRNIALTLLIFSFGLLFVLALSQIFGSALPGPVAPVKQPKDDVHIPPLLTGKQWEDLRRQQRATE
jgi:hypothetical protein